MGAMKKKAIKDIFGLEVDIEGVDDAPDQEKYIYIEDKHAIGDLDLLDNEAQKDENQQTVTFFIILFMIASMAAIVCCYLNYTFSQELSQNVFIVFGAALLCEIILVRNIMILILSLIKYFKACCKGYRYIEFKSSREVKKLLNEAMKHRFRHHAMYGTTKGGPTPGKDQQTLGGKTLKDSEEDGGEIKLDEEEKEADEEAQEVPEEEEKYDADGNAAHTHENFLATNTAALQKTGADLEKGATAS